MFHSTDPNHTSFPNVRLIEQALKSLKNNLSVHFEQEARLEQLFSGRMQNWTTQFEQLRHRIEELEARLSPWMVEPADGPRLAMIAPQEEVA